MKGKQSFLLDTHVLLWWLEGGSTLSQNSEDLISDPTSVVFVSAASIWEIRIKEGIGKISLPNNFAEVLATQVFERLPITFEHANALKNLPLHHCDPFDRMLIVQSKLDGLTLLARNEAFSKYDVDLITA